MHAVVHHIITPYANNACVTSTAILTHSFLELCNIFYNFLMIVRKLQNYEMFVPKARKVNPTFLIVGVFF